TALTSPEPIYQRDFSYDIDNPKQEIEHHIAKVSAYKRFENFGKSTALTSPEPIYQRDFSYDIDNPKQEIEHHIAKV
ncbi:hypothetical protein, partial [Chryseobacterium sp. CH1]|uniref:hypothetical protein n=1 Tax=Chryseobacterium sp. CH1 TaxID=713551 RepID=UPI0010280D74